MGPSQRPLPYNTQHPQETDVCAHVGFFFYFSLRGPCVLIVLVCLSSLHSTQTQTSMAPAEIEPAIPASEWPQAYALDRRAKEMGGFEITIPANKWPQTLALDRSATRIGTYIFRSLKFAQHIKIQLLL